MNRSTTIATLTAAALLATGVAWAGVGAGGDDGAQDAPVVAATADAAPTDGPTADDSPSDGPTDETSPSDAVSADDSPSDDDVPVAAVRIERVVLDAGSITVQAEGFDVDLVAAVPADGWRVVIEQDGPAEVDLSFRRGEERVDVGVEVDDGAVRIRIRDRRTDEQTEEYVGPDGTTSGPLDDGSDDDRSGDDLRAREDDDLDDDDDDVVDDATDDDDSADSVDSVDSPDSDDSDDTADDVDSVDSPDSDDSDDTTDDVDSVDSPDSDDSDD